jgi:hypothetical protein
VGSGWFQHRAVLLKLAGLKTCFLYSEYFSKIFKTDSILQIMEKCTFRDPKISKLGMSCHGEDRDRSRRPGAEDQGWSSIGQILGVRMIERLGDIVCGLYRA